ncbi:hypothetical protein Trydic_g1456 [Trypoxylus dichotomus]
MDKKKRKSFLDMLLKSSQNGHILSEQDIREEDHDTTTAGICWSLFLLGNHPQIQEKVYEEVSGTLQDKSTTTSIAELRELKYLACCIKETMRLYPSVPIIARTVQQEVILDGHRNPAGVRTVLHIYGIHRSAKYYPDPDKFAPDRFFPENSKGRHPYSYIPFSAGPRNCIGQKFAMYKEKTVLASIVKRYKITSMEIRENIVVTADLILRSMNGMYEYLAALGAVVVVWYIISYYKWLRDIYYPMKEVPSVGVVRIPILGTKYKFIGVPREELFNMGVEIVRKRGPIFSAWTGSSPELVVAKPEYLEVILNNSIHITKGRQYKSLMPWLGQGLLTSTGARWFQHRKLITPTFHFKILENFVDIFVSKSQALLEMLDAKANGTSFDIYPDITHCALDIICETAMGVSVNAMSNAQNEYVASLYGISEIIVWRFLRPYIIDFIFKFTSKGQAFEEHLNILHSFTRKVIAERKKQRLNNKSNNELNADNTEDEILGKKKKMSFLDLLLESSADGQVLNDQDIAEEVDTFMFEGHDTTTAAMCWTLFLLGNHPEIQQKVCEEVSTILQNKSTPTTLKELNEMKYLENVIKESLRLYPSVPLIVRELKQQVTIGKYKIPAGTQALLHIFGVHRDPEYYPQPNKFDPDRFLPENSQGRHPYAYIPFSAGPRNCIGQKFAMYEEKTILASIVNRYKITALESQETIKLVGELILRPMNGVILKLARRQ